MDVLFIGRDQKIRVLGAAGYCKIRRILAFLYREVDASFLRIGCGKLSERRNRLSLSHRRLKG